MNKNMKKVLDKVCIDCINANKHLKIATNFKVGVEFGTCDCCGKKYILVPFGRFFDSNVEIIPCTDIEKLKAAKLKTDNEPKIVITKDKPRIDDEVIWPKYTKGKAKPKDESKDEEPKADPEDAKPIDEPKDEDNIGTLDFGQ